MLHHILYNKPEGSQNSFYIGVKFKSCFNVIKTPAKRSLCHNDSKMYSLTILLNSCKMPTNSTATYPAHLFSPEELFPNLCKMPANSTAMYPAHTYPSHTTLSLPIPSLPPHPLPPHTPPHPHPTPHTLLTCSLLMNNEVPL